MVIPTYSYFLEIFGLVLDFSYFFKIFLFFQNIFVLYLFSSWCHDLGP